MAGKIYHQIHDEAFLERSLFSPGGRLQEHPMDYHTGENFEKGAIQFLFYLPEELVTYIGLCDRNIGRGYNNPQAISMREISATRLAKHQLYYALKEHVRRQRGLDTLDFSLGRFELNREKLAEVTGRDIRDLGPELDTRCKE